MIERTFLPADQDNFAALSGDWNPLHVDPMAARRLMYGRTVVHGIHLLLWALDKAFAGFAHPISLISLVARFHAPVVTGEPAALEISSVEQETRCRVHSARGLSATIAVKWTSGIDANDRCPEGAFERRAPNALGYDEIANACGTIDLNVDRAPFRRLFPNVILPLRQAAFLLACTRLVGMQCPGLHSIFGGLRLSFEPHFDGDRLEYRVTRFDRRLSRALIELKGSGVGGEAEAYVRPAPLSQPPFSSLQQVVSATEFKERRALVVGASRGLGEITAKLLAAGGANVTLTYCRGERDARAVADEIARYRSTPSLARLDATAEQCEMKAVVAALGEVTHMYYFATAPIFVARRGHFDPGLFDDFCRVYVSGFVQLTGLLAPRGLKMVVFPSSSAIEEMPIDMGEYCAAKAAGEVAGRFLERCYPGITVLSPRLPRLPTDQTRTLLPSKDTDPVPILLEFLRAG